MQVQLVYNDPPNSPQQRLLTLSAPIAFGREAARMPSQIGGSRVSQVILSADERISRFHAEIDYQNGQLILRDRSTGGTYVNGIRQTETILNNGDTIQIGSYQIQLTFAISPPPTLEQIGLVWEDPTTGERNESILAIPIAIGREVAKMPAQIQNRSVSRLLLDSLQVSRFHALIEMDGRNLTVSDRNSSGGTFVNGIRKTQSILGNGDIIQIGPYQISINLGVIPAVMTVPGTVIGGSNPPPQPLSIIGFNPDTGLLAPAVVPPPIPANFPPASFSQELISLDDIRTTKLSFQEADYAAIGAGLGSYIWVDYLRICGVKPQQIIALGLEAKPYARYKQLCLNSQIPLYERLRSNSDSCPDNIWGWPSYAWREAVQDLSRGRLADAIKELWQVFGEPTLIETYTPRAGNVFNSIDREATRIGWHHIYQYGRVRAIRKTTDGRYCIAYSGTNRQHCFIIARYLHLAPGYPAIQFLPDLQEYRQKTGDFKSVVNAYEEHNHVYDYLAKNGGTVLIRGRGIVASRVVQRIYETRKINKNITLVHLMRSPKPEGNKYEKTQRTVDNHYEFQPFNWPKACWTGELRELLEKSDPNQRRALLQDWGGTTTADRTDWRKIVQAGIQQGWYRIRFGEVETVEKDPKNITITRIREMGIKGLSNIEADFIIDCTGLDAKVTASPLLDDLVKQYHLPLNYNGRIFVENDFEIKGMRNQQAKMYAAGAITLGGPYAAADSFLGLQYAGLIAVDSLAKSKAPGVHKLTAIRSLTQWLKWVANSAP
jgi:pSer/pThr/pTyr-binding forkhead associated (FHA) protein